MRTASVLLLSNFLVLGCDKSKAAADPEPAPTAATSDDGADAASDSAPGPALSAAELLEGASSDYGCFVESDAHQSCGITCNEGFDARCASAEGGGVECQCFEGDREAPEAMAKGMCSCPTAGGGLCLATACTADAPPHCDCQGAYGSASVCGCGSDWAG